ncbi:MAG: GntR family transcriptional regulator [Candidatus Rokuibacteriota bacterium]|nr:MAG: GntR family transcriptional regulator [Candidatus Rokubacteria bacterium]
MTVRSSSRQGLSIGLTHDGQPVRSLTSAVFAQLRAEILSCRLKPGEKLLIAGLARRFGVSLSAVREALSRLGAEGLVKAEDQRGFHVSPVSIDGLRDLTRTRIDIEGLALRRAIELGDARWEDAVRAAYAQLAEVALPRPGDAGPRFENWRALHHRFHLALVSACGSAWLLRFRQTLYEQSERYRFLAHRMRQRPVEAEHAAIVQAVLARDPDAAVNALGDHFALTAEIIAESSWGEAHRSTPVSRSVRV